jgi:spore coat protein CotH
MFRTLSPFALAAVAALAGAAPARAADPLFDQERLHEVRLSMRAADWQALRANFMSDDYYVADVALDGVAVRGIGVRSRGSGSRSGTKPALKLDFNEYVSSQQYGGYKELVLDNLVQDVSFVRERLAFAVFEAVGIPAPQNSYARLYVNDEYWGLYQVTEPVGKPFLKARLGEDKGNLFDYEYATRWDFSYRGADPREYVPVPFKPETNEDDLDPSALVDFIRAITDTPDEDFVRTMQGWLDVPRLLTYVAVENALAERDGLLGEEGMNNFFLYQYGGERRFTFVPWDKDTCLHHADWPAFLRVETNVLVRRLLSDAGQQKLYLETLRRVASSYVNPRWLTPRLESAYTQIREAALQDPHKPQSNDELELSIAGLRGVIAGREVDVLAQTRELARALR